MRKEEVLRKNPKMVTRVIDDETILLPVFKTADEISYVYTLNKSASEVWKMIDGKRSLSNIKDRIIDRFDSSAKEADTRLSRLLKDLKSIGAVI